MTAWTVVKIEIERENQRILECSQILRCAVNKLDKEENAEGTSDEKKMEESGNAPAEKKESVVLLEELELTKVQEEPTGRNEWKHD